MDIENYQSLGSTSDLPFQSGIYLQYQSLQINLTVAIFPQSEKDIP